MPPAYCAPRSLSPVPPHPTGRKILNRRLACAAQSSSVQKSGRGGYNRHAPRRFMLARTL